MSSIQLIQTYFPHLSTTQINQIEAAVSTYKDWNDKINVISRKDIDQIYLHHFLHSMSILQFKSFDNGRKFIDVGTGGGFPGVPLAICLPECEFILVDSIGKKLKVINEVCKSANIKNIVTIHERAEKYKDSTDYVTGRAVETLKEFYMHTQHLIPRNRSSNEKGILYLKGGDLTQEIKELNRPIQEFSIQERIKEEYFETKKLVFIPIQ